MKERSSGRLSAVSLPKLELPSGGGRTASPATTYTIDENLGAGALPYPLDLPLARDLTLELSLLYSSGGGNGIFGIGFGANIPSIGINLRFGVPRYDGNDPMTLGGAPLVPALVEVGGSWQRDAREETIDGVVWQVLRYVPRVEGDFTLIEHWRKAAPEAGQDLGPDPGHWYTLSGENIESWYGRDADSRVADPAEPHHVVEWLIAESRNAKGERIVFDYRREDRIDVPDAPAERGRTIGANLYPDRIRYGNYWADGEELFAYTVSFDYGGYDLDDPAKPVSAWSARPDPYSTYNSGFERRWYRLCRGMVVSVALPELFGGTPTPVRAYGFDYDPQPSGVLLTGIRKIGYRWAEGNVALETLPALRLGFSAFTPQQGRFHELTTGGTLPAAPGYLAAQDFQLVDLDGAGLPGVLQADGTAALYWPPKGDGQYGAAEARPFPIERDLGAADLALMDLDADGDLDLVVTAPTRAGFYGNKDGAWDAFRPFETAPTVLGQDGQYVDLDGNGIADYLVFREDDLLVYPSLGRRGFAPAMQLPRPFPLASPADPGLRTEFAGMFGDGLQHWVAIRDGEILCWPSLGRGRFGAAVAFDNAPHFGDGFDASRVRLVDVDGSGCADIIYVRPDRIDLYRNLNGSGFADPIAIRLPATFSLLDGLTTADVLGSGCSGLVFTRTTPTAQQLFYDFGIEGTPERPKPYLLVETDNAMGAISRIGYRSSTRDYLDDQRRGQPWLTRLPFPVQVVARIEVLEQVTGSRLVSAWRYHDGYFDQTERVFRGFGYVERQDSERYEDFAKGNLFAAGTFEVAADATLHQPPSLARTWYEVGAPDPFGLIAKARQRQYFHGDPDAYRMPDARLDPAIWAQARPLVGQARSAMAGRILREEIYADDPAPQAAIPFRVSETRCFVRLLQPDGPNLFASFLVGDCETIRYDYEQVADDPRVEHDFALAIDAYGNVTRDCLIQYPRRPGKGTGDIEPGRVPEQDALFATATLYRVINAATGMRWLGLPCETQTYELAGIALGPTGYFTFTGIEAAVATALANPLPYGDPFTPGAAQARLFGWSRTYYWDDAQDAAMPLGQTGKRALVHHSPVAAFPDGLPGEQRLFSASPDGVGDLDQGIVPPELRAGLEAKGIALPAGDRTIVTIVEAGRAWAITDTDIGQVYPVAVVDDELRVFRRVLGPLASGAPAIAGYALEEGYWWNRGEVTRFASAPEQFYMLVETANDFAPADNPLAARTSYGYDRSWLHATELTAWLSATEQNVTRLAMDYQALLPAHVVDPNGIVQESLYDALGRTLVTSLNKGDAGDLPVSDYIVRAGATFDDVLARPAYYLQGASSFVFDASFAWLADGQPAARITLARETRVSDLPPGGSSAIQIDITFHDGLARTIETKRVSEPGEAVVRQPSGALAPTDASPARVEPVEVRWWVSGRTVYNNKGRPLAVYLPYFSATPHYERQADVDAAGLLPPPTTVRYDALGRAVRVDLPKGFFERSVYEPWCRRLYDADDTVTHSDYYRAHIDDPDTPAAEREALAKAAIFDDTPDLIALDPAGNPVRRVQILVEAVDGAPGPRSYLTTRLTLDAAARVVAIADPRLMAHVPPIDNVQYLVDMAGSKLLEVAVDAGSRARLADIFDCEVLQLDGRGVAISKTYDRLQRLTVIDVRPNALDPAPPPWVRVEHVVYGEDAPDNVAHNLRGEIYRAFDQAGVVAFGDYNIQGQAVVQRRDLAAAPGEIDWNAPPPLEPVPLVTRWHFDALDRIVWEQCPDGRRTRPGYGPSSLMTTLAVEDGATVRPFVTDIAYNASDQRTRIALANGAISAFRYEPTTLRLTEIRTAVARGDGTTTMLQDRSYTYDPVGNVTQTADNLRQTQFHANQAVSPVCDYGTDSIYRLTRATGVQQVGLAAIPGSALPPRDRRETAELENYLQTYRYDAGSNLTELRHRAASGNWTRTIDVAALSNRARPQGVAAGYDANGNMTDLGPLSGMEWSWRNGLLGVAQITREDGEDDDAVFDYDGRGRRVRKTVRRKISTNECEVEETVYQGAYERRRVARIAGGVSTLIVERHDLRLLDDIRYGESAQADDASANRDAHGGTELSPAPRADGRWAFATEYRWTLDSRARETADPATLLTRYPLQSLLGSITVELDDAATVISDEEYYPYGETAVFSAVSPGDAALKAYRFVGKERDGATGLYYFGARYYAPGFGRWLSADPAGFADGTNLYIYVGANPVSHTDPTGLGKATKSEQQLKAERAQAKGRVTKAEGRIKTAETRLKKATTPSQVKRYQKELSALRQERGRARAAVTRLTNQINKLKSAKGGSVPTRPAFHNPGGPLVFLMPPTHPGPSWGTLISSPPSTAYIADLHKEQRTSAVESDVRNYTMMANRYIQSLPTKQLVCVSSNRGTTGSIGYNAGKIASEERKLANNATPGTYASDQVVGHVPDVAATGVSYSPLGWFAQTKVSNSIVGGGLNPGRVITVYLVKEQDGNVYQY